MRALAAVKRRGDMTKRSFIVAGDGNDGGDGWRWY